MTGLGRIRLPDMLRAGPRAVTQYTGTLLAVYVAQVLAAWLAGFTILFILASTFGARPLFDEAVDGDLVALLTVLTERTAVFAAVGWVMVGAVVAWVAWSWFLTGGLLTVLTERPRGRLETARVFGGGGAATFLVYARLALVAAVLHLPALYALGLGLGYFGEHLATAMTVGELVGPALVGFGPAAVLAVIASTVVDYARAELTLRRPTHGSLGAARAAVRAVGYLIRRPVALGHALVYWLAWMALWAAFVWLAYDHAMLGTGGALALFAVRQVAGLARMALKVGLLAGQVELTSTRPPPPRTVARVEPRER
ncbi:MAG: hypothetical protein R3B06_07070 [Kofleriaceae bacterium]